MDPQQPRSAGTAAEVFRAFLGLGVTSFGGPVAHLGYFRQAFVEKRRWMTEDAYADLVALCQFLPGPASSQVGMAIGLRRAGWLGLLAAWVGFTLPSALLMVAFGYGLVSFGWANHAGWIVGLKAAAVAVVAHAVTSMARTLAPDRPRATIAAAACVVLLVVDQPLMQLGVLAAGAVVGLRWLAAPAPLPVQTDAPARGRGGLPFLVMFAGLLAVLPLLAGLTGNAGWQLADGFYRAGSLVFGGGHVVLPLLDAETVQRGLLSQDAFLAGYGAAQAVPGPLFTFSAYLGFVLNQPPNGLLGAAIALVAIFLPSALLIAGVLPWWDQLRRMPRIQKALLGVNAAVVGLLGAALYQPVFTSGVTSPGTVAVAVAGYLALAHWRVPAWAVVLVAALIGLLVW